jgi:hypothetical protein
VNQLTGDEALSLRMASLQLAASRAVPRPTDVGDVARWFGALQGQDLTSLLWSLGIRLPHATVTDVEAALETGGVLRTWPMRGTIHLVPAVDARWMLRVLGEKPLAGAAKRRESLGLSTRDADRAVDVLGEALEGGRRLTRAQCQDALVAGGIDSAGQRGYHLLWYASQRGVTCIAPNVDGEQTFVLLDDWAPEQRDLTREEALAEIALCYFRSHGPTTRKDFAGWAGITAGEAKAGISECGDALVTADVDGVEMVLSAELAGSLGPSTASADADRASIAGWLALPGFDEYLLGFKDRSLMVDAAGMQAVIPGKNGVFRATIVRDGRVVGTWKRTFGVKAVTVEVAPLPRGIASREREAVQEALQGYAAFMGRDLAVRWA